MFSWNGFIFKLDGLAPADGGANEPLLVYGLIAITALAVFVVWLGRDFYLSVAATIVGMLLISTHSVWYDWAMLGLMAVFLIVRSQGIAPAWKVSLWTLLLGLHLAASQSMAALLQPDRHFIDWFHPAFYSVTLLASGVLLWMVAFTLKEGTLRLPFSARS
jgi:hypothetical protein